MSEIHDREDHEESAPAHCTLATLQPRLMEPGVKVILFIGAPFHPSVHALGLLDPRYAATAQQLQRDPPAQAPWGPWRLAAPTRVLCAGHEPRTVEPSHLMHPLNDEIAAGVALRQMCALELGLLPAAYASDLERYACALRRSWAKADRDGDMVSSQEERRLRMAESSVWFVPRLIRYAVQAGWFPREVLSMYEAMVAQVEAEMRNIDDWQWRCPAEQAGAPRTTSFRSLVVSLLGKRPQ